MSNSVISLKSKAQAFINESKNNPLVAKYSEDSIQVLLEHYEELRESDSNITWESIFDQSSEYDANSLICEYLEGHYDTQEAIDLAEEILYGAAIVGKNKGGYSDTRHLNDLAINNSPVMTKEELIENYHNDLILNEDFCSLICKEFISIDTGLIPHKVDSNTYLALAV